MPKLFERALNSAGGAAIDDDRGARLCEGLSARKTNSIARTGYEGSLARQINVQTPAPLRIKPLLETRGGIAEFAVSRAPRWAPGQFRCLLANVTRLKYQYTKVYANLDVAH